MPWSSGNHGLAISHGARILGVKVTVLMPQDAPRIKVDGVRANGAAVRLYDKRTENREAIGCEIAAQTGAVIVPPYDDAYVIAGQSTVGAEIAEQVAENGQRLDGLLLPCSGGGLASGAACGVHMLSPETSVFTVEPQCYDCVARSYALGQAVVAPADGTSICDALLVATPGHLTWPFVQKAHGRGADCHGRRSFGGCALCLGAAEACGGAGRSCSFGSGSCWQGGRGRENGCCGS